MTCNTRYPMKGDLTHLVTTLWFDVPESRSQLCYESPEIYHTHSFQNLDGTTLYV